jgi:hypothetical protein
MLSLSLFSLQHLELQQTILDDTIADLALCTYCEFLETIQNDPGYDA